MLVSLAYETFKDFFNHCDCCKRWLLFAERFNDSLFSLTVDESPFLVANYGCKMDICTGFENHRKSLVQRCERSELCLHFERTKVNLKGQKWSIFASFWKFETYGQTVLPDRLLLRGQKLVKKAKIQMRHFGWFSNTVHTLDNSQSCLNDTTVIKISESRCK